MKGFITAIGIITVAVVALKPNSASRLASGSGLITNALRKFMSPTTPGIPNVAGAPVPVRADPSPGPVPLQGVPGISAGATPAPVITT